MPIAVVFTVGFVVFFVVADQIAQSEAVVCSNEVDAGRRSAAAVVENIGRPGQAFGKCAQITAFPRPKRAHIITETAVPFGKRLREIAQVIAALADVPGFDNQLQTSQYRVLIQNLEKTAVRLEIGFASQYGSQVETEAVNMKLFGPIAQAVCRPTGNVATDNIERIAAT